MAVWGMAVPNGPNPAAGGTGSPRHAAVGTYGRPAGDGSSQTAQGHQIGGQEVLPTWRPMPMEGLQEPFGNFRLPQTLYRHRPPPGRDSPSPQLVGPGCWELPSPTGPA